MPTATATNGQSTNGHQTLPLDVLIVGSGIGGLSAAIACKAKGFSVTVLESTPKYSHVGAGIFLGGNATKVLLDWNLEEEVRQVSVDLINNQFISQDGENLSRSDYKTLAKEIGYPLLQMHRADLHDVLFKKALSLGVVVKMGRVVKEYDAKTPKAITTDCKVYEADVIFAADGYRSNARSQLLGRIDEPRPSGNSAYRALIPTEPLKQYPELAPFLNWVDQTTWVWVGPGCHIVLYLLRQGTVLNMVLTQSAKNVNDDNYVVKVDPAEVIERYKDWDPRLVTMLKHLPKDNTLEWRLCDMEPMETWVFPHGKIALIGDACHAVLPSAAQGAGMAIEDGAAVAELLARVKSKDEILAALKAYDELRIPRCAVIMTGARGDAKRWQGKTEGKPVSGVSSSWSWSYDIAGAAREVKLEA